MYIHVFVCRCLCVCGITESGAHDHQTCDPPWTKKSGGSGDDVPGFCCSAMVKNSSKKPKIGHILHPLVIKHGNGHPLFTRFSPVPANF